MGAGAFNFGASAAEPKRPVWGGEGGRKITVQDIYQFPGFCFNGAVIAWLEAQARSRPISPLAQASPSAPTPSLVPGRRVQTHLSADEKNARCELPPPPPPPGGGAPPPALGATAGVVGALEAGHPLLVSLRNLGRWYDTPGMGEWLHSLRLFSLTNNGYSLEEGRALAARLREGLAAAGVPVEG